MVGAFHLRDAAWALTTLLEVILLFYVVRRRLYRIHPAFSLYILAAVLQGVAVAWSARQWGIQSVQYFDLVWGTQAAVVCARWFAVAEIARRVFQGYSGIRRMTSGILFVVGTCVLVYASALSKYRWDLIVLNADRAVELCIATFIVTMLVFVKYYRLAMTNLERQLAIGFCLYSCSWVINNSVYELVSHPSAFFWQYFQIFSFLASLTIWIVAAVQPVEVRRAAIPLALSAEQYVQLSRQLNARLNLLNSRLNRLLRSEDSQ